MSERSKARRFPFTFGGDPEALCEECRLPCSMERMSVDCHRRLFMAGMLHCSYFVGGYCFLVDLPGCVFDNGGRHETYWLQLLNEYIHNVDDREEDEAFEAARSQARSLVDERISSGAVCLCRYLEQYYTQIMETGGGLSEEMLSRLDDAYLSLLKGISRKSD